MKFDCLFTKTRERMNHFYFSIDFYIIGDCGTPATIYQATSQAYYAARDIGRI